MYIATFFTQYGAQIMHKELKETDPSARLMPVPRILSAACGICVTFESERSDEIKARVPEDMEALYEYDGAGYSLIFEAEE